MLIGNASCVSCPVTLECAVGGLGATVWKGTSFDCDESSDEITLLHSRFNTTDGNTVKTCGGAIVAYTIGVKDNHYISRLLVNATEDLLEKTIQCAYDDGLAEYTVFSTTIANGTVLHCVIGDMYIDTSP